MRRAARKKNAQAKVIQPLARPKQAVCWTLFAMAALAATPVYAKSITVTQEYKYTIEQARTGRHDWALQWLDQQSRLHPDDFRIKHDQIIISSWAGRYQDVIKIHQSLPPQALPLPRTALAAVARAYRDDKQWSVALQQYQEGKRRFPSDDTFSVGEALVLADSGETQLALQRAGALVERAPRDPQSLIVQSYIHRINKRPYEAFTAASRAYQLAPTNPHVIEEYVSALSAIDLADAALRIARAHPDVISTERLRVLQADRAAELTRLASHPARQESERYAVADRALEAYREMPSDPSVLGNSQAQVYRQRVDRLIALNARHESHQVIQEYEALEAEGVQVPHYALGHVAAAYLDDRQPEKSAELYNELLSAEQGLHIDPSVRLSHQSGLFYSFVEAEQLDDAQTAISTAAQEQPALRKIRGTPLPEPNELNLTASEQAALGYLYADNAPQAQELLEHMVERAPGHSALRSSLSEVYLARGWPRRAEEELKLAETHSPRAIEVMNEQARTALQLQEWQQAEALINDVSTRYPEHAQVKKLVRDWERHNRSELRISGQKGLASNSPVAGDGDLRLDAVIYTPPINYNWRGFAGAGYGKADFEDANADFHWYRAGVEWRGRDLSIEAEVSSNHYGQGGKVGARAQVAYDLNDQWQVGGQFAFRSQETPFKALANNITSNRLDAYVRWRAHERREWRLMISPSRFSDGNTRIEALLTGRERVYTAPHYKLDALLDVSASRNTRRDAPYFNPRADFAILPGLALTHTLYRRYENVLEQRFMVGAGLYAQRGFGSGAIATVGYGLRYRYNEMLDAGVSITGISRPYDGRREREARILFDLNIRF